MYLAATVAVYPLAQPDYRAVDRAIETLRSKELELQVQTMHTEVYGPDEALFSALARAYRAAAELGPVVMVVTITNACSAPEPGSGE